jgi:hypothetical protein
MEYSRLFYPSLTMSRCGCLRFGAAHPQSCGSGKFVWSGFPLPCNIVVPTFRPSTITFAPGWPPPQAAVSSGSAAFLSGFLPGGRHQEYSGDPVVLLDRPGVDRDPHLIALGAAFARRPPGGVGSPGQPQKPQARADLSRRTIVSSPAVTSAVRPFSFPGSFVPVLPAAPVPGPRPSPERPARSRRGPAPPRSCAGSHRSQGRRTGASRCPSTG